MFDMFSVLWWVLVVGELLGLVAALRFEKGGIGLASLGGVLTVMDLFGDMPVFTTLWSYKYIVLLYVVAYIGLGLLWSFGKWHRFTKWHATQYAKIRELFAKEKGLTSSGPIPEQFHHQFRDWLSNRYRRPTNNDLPRGEIKFKPKVSTHKQMLMGWLLLWPASMLETFIANFVIGLFENVYLWSTGVYRRIMERNFKQFASDFGD